MIPSKHCKHKGCNREAISFSRFCGQHSANKDIISRLKTTRIKNFKNLYLDKVELKKLTFKQKTFQAAIIQDTDFEQTVFENCSFQSCHFSNVVFANTIFLNCYFFQWDCKDVTFNETTFKGCSLDDWTLNQCFFGDETAIMDSSINACEITGGFFSETGQFTNVKFLSTNFVQASFAQAQFLDCQLIENSFAKTSLYDSSFRDCLFDSLTHDFKITGIPMLCDFRGSRFVNTLVPKSMREWNNLGKEPVSFYQSVIAKILPVSHSNYLGELAVCLRRLSNAGQRATTELTEDINELFKRLLNAASLSGDYSDIGRILEEYGKVPEEFRKRSSFILPPPDSGTNEPTGMARLTIEVQLDNWRLNRVNEFIDLLAQLESHLPFTEDQRVNFIEKGSLIIQIAGWFKGLYTPFRLLLDWRKTKAEINGMSIDI